MIAALLLFCAAEAIVRIFFASSMEGRFEYGFHPTAGFRENKDGTVTLARTGGRRFHPQAFLRHKPEGVFRIMVVGDSVPRGPNLEDSYPYQLGEVLRARGINAESYNLGVAGYGARRKEIVFKQALEYEPSLIVLHVNNFTEYHDEREFRRSQEFKSWHPKNWLMKSMLLRRIHEAKTEQVFWRWLPQEIRGQTEVNDVDAQIVAAKDEATTRQWDELVKKCTAECVAVAREKKIPVLLITRASVDVDSNGKPFLVDGGLNAMVAEFKGPGCYLLSQKDVFEGLDYVPMFYRDRMHMFRPGHTVMAEAIAKKLIDEGLSQLN